MLILYVVLWTKNAILLYIGKKQNITLDDQLHFIENLVICEQTRKKR